MPGAAITSRTGTHLSPQRPRRSSFRVPTRPAPTPPGPPVPPSMLDSLEQEVRNLPQPTRPAPSPPGLSHHLDSASPYTRLSHTSASLTRSQSHSHLHQPQLARSTDTYTTAHPGSRPAQLAQAQAPMLALPTRTRSLRDQRKGHRRGPSSTSSTGSGSYHALMPEHARNELVVSGSPNEFEPVSVPSARSNLSVSTLAYMATPEPKMDKRRCSIIAMTPCTGHKAKCHYDPFARRAGHGPLRPASTLTNAVRTNTTNNPAIQEETCDGPRDSITPITRAGGSSVGGSSVFVRKSTSWTADAGDNFSTRSGSVRSAISSNSATGRVVINA